MGYAFVLFLNSEYTEAYLASIGTFRRYVPREWAVKRKNKEKKKSQLKEDDQVVVRVSIPYTKGLSER